MKLLTIFIFLNNIASDVFNFFVFLTWFFRKKKKKKAIILNDQINKKLLNRAII